LRDGLSDAEVRERVQGKRERLVEEERRLVQRSWAGGGGKAEDRVVARL
jgi:hypothetical protein